MDTQRFGQIARLFAGRRSRRATIGGGLGLAAAAVAPSASRVAAQEATPEVVTSTDPHPGADAPAKTEYLFVQPFAGGSWSPKAGEDDVYSLTLTGAPAQTAYFSDRPERIFGLAPTEQFLDGLGFTPANPPNAALVAQRKDGDDQEVLVVELLNPAYDAAAGALTYDAKVLADYGEPGLAHAARQQTDYEFPEAFAEGSLFIDDCENHSGSCYQVVNGERVIVGEIDLPQCAQFLGVFRCDLCGDGNDPHYGKLCNEAYPDQCSYYSNGLQGWDCYVDFIHARP